MRITRLMAGTVTAGLLGLTPIAIAAPSQATDNLTTATTATPEPDHARVRRRLLRQRRHHRLRRPRRRPTARPRSTRWRPAPPTGPPVATDDCPGSYFFDVKPRCRRCLQGRLQRLQRPPRPTRTTTPPASRSPFTVAVSRKVAQEPAGHLDQGQGHAEVRQEEDPGREEGPQEVEEVRDLKTNKAGKYRSPCPRAAARPVPASPSRGTPSSPRGDEGYTYSARTAVYGERCSGADDRITARPDGPCRHDRALVRHLPHDGLCDSGTHDPYAVARGAPVDGRRRGLPAQAVPPHPRRRRRRCVASTSWSPARPRPMACRRSSPRRWRAPPAVPRHPSEAARDGDRRAEGDPVAGGPEADAARRSRAHRSAGDPRDRRTPRLAASRPRRARARPTGPGCAPTSQPDASSARCTRPPDADLAGVLPAWRIVAARPRPGR